MSKELKMDTIAFSQEPWTAADEAAASQWGWNIKCDRPGNRREPGTLLVADSSDSVFGHLGAILERAMRFQGTDTQYAQTCKKALRILGYVTAALDISLPVPGSTLPHTVMSADSRNGTAGFGYSTHGELEHEDDLEATLDKLLSELCIPQSLKVKVSSRCGKPKLTLSPTGYFESSSGALTAHAHALHRSYCYQVYTVASMLTLPRPLY